MVYCCTGRHLWEPNQLVCWDWPFTFWGGVELGAWAFNFQPQKDAAAINCPVLLQWGVTDPRVTESETHQIFKNLASREKELIKYVQSGHQSLCKNEKSKWYMTVGRFLMM